MSEKDEIAAETAIFTGTGTVGEAMTLFPLGSNTGTVNFNGVLDEDALPGTNETRGDGRILNNQFERSERRSAIIEAPISLLPKMNFPQDLKRPDKVKDSSGETWTVKRLMGKDHAMFSFLVIHKDKVEQYKRARSG